MSIRLYSLVALALTGVGASVVHGGDLLRAMVDDFQEVNQWPCPYVCWDREAVEAPLAIVVQKGWARQNVLADPHFVGSQGELSSAGQYKLRWILTEAPVERRTIFVRRAETAEQTAARVAAVRRYASRVAPEAGPVSILETGASSLGYPAGWPNNKDDSSIARKFQPFVPDKIYLPNTKSNSTN